MKIEQLVLSNFRSYNDEIIVNFNDLNVFVGKNDIGKSTILEALDIFFNEGKGLIKIEKDDINKNLLAQGNEEIKISVIFGDLPPEITIDSTNSTTLCNEYLLNQHNKLEIIKKYPKAGKEKVFVKAYHPSNPQCSDLLSKKQDFLKKKIQSENIPCEDKTKNSVMRNAIWRHYSDNLDLIEQEIELAKIDEKNTWDQLKKHLPLYALFQSDRKNSDGDNEVQNPMKLAVQEILKDQRLMDILNNVATEVEAKLQEVAANTLDKLNEMNPEIAQSLTPVIPTADSLKWIDVFKNVSITGDDDIPINKRGSGVKRLVLLNFFRAEVDRRKNQSNIQDVIYAIEEPETSQHPHHQKKLIEAFIELSKSDNTQIILTTHSPAVVKLLKFEHLKLIKHGTKKEVVNVEKKKLPYPSLNEVNYSAFSETNDEYHNELYGFIESEELLSEYKAGKSTLEYKRQFKGKITIERKILSEYIRHQIHHPENINNPKYTESELLQSIKDMREFIENNSIK